MSLNMSPRRIYSSKNDSKLEYSLRSKLHHLEQYIISTQALKMQFDISKIVSKLTIFTALPIRPFGVVSKYAASKVHF